MTAPMMVISTFHLAQSGCLSMPREQVMIGAKDAAYRVRLADAADFGQIMALRRARFGAGEDAFDSHSTQIMVQDKDQLIATFRLREFSNGAAAQMGYTGQFYDLSALAHLTGPVLELGRFCVADGALQVDALRLAFAAMAAQVDHKGAGLLFGCSSFLGRDLALHRAALGHLTRHIHPHWDITATAAHVIDLRALSPCKAQDVAALRAMPPLLRSYLSLGGWVGGQAVRDDDLDTIHVFTALEVAAIPAARARALRAMAAGLSLGD